MSKTRTARCAQSRMRGPTPTLFDIPVEGQPPLRLTMAAGGCLVVASGVIHLHLWAAGYRHVPTIGPLFLFQGVSGVVLGVVAALSRRILIALAGAGFMLATIGGFVLSASVGFFGFHDSMAAPWAMVSLIVEGTGGAFLALPGMQSGLHPGSHRRRHHGPAPGASLLSSESCQYRRGVTK